MKLLGTAKKSLGQNFLMDNNIINKIIKISDINKNKYLWEKRRQQNLTGTSETYRPKKISENKNIKKKYETWKI